MSFKNTLVLVVALGWVTAVWYLTIPPRQQLSYRAQALEHSLEIEKQRCQLLNDELLEIRSRRTYEDGYRDALLKAENSDHASGYVDGYHAAIRQFGHAAPAPAIAKGGE